MLGCLKQINLDSIGIFYLMLLRATIDLPTVILGRFDQAIPSKEGDGYGLCDGAQV